MPMSYCMCEPMETAPYRVWSHVSVGMNPSPIDKCSHKDARKRQRVTTDPLCNKLAKENKKRKREGNRENKREDAANRLRQKRTATL